MKVFMNKRKGGYSGGMILVAANSAEEAHETFHNDCDFLYMWTELDGTITDFYYQPIDWEEVSNLEYHGEYPCVIAEEGYTE